MNSFKQGFCGAYGIICRFLFLLDIGLRIYKPAQIYYNIFHEKKHYFFGNFLDLISFFVFIFFEDCVIMEKKNNFLLKKGTQ